MVKNAILQITCYIITRCLHMIAIAFQFNVTPVIEISASSLSPEQVISTILKYITSDESGTSLSQVQNINFFGVCLQQWWKKESLFKPKCISVNRFCI